MVKIRAYNASGKLDIESINTHPTETASHWEQEFF